MKKSAILAALLLTLLGVCRKPVNLYAGELLIGTSTGYPPYYFVENGKLAGVCVEVINQTAQLLGMKTVYKQYPWKRMLHSGKTGQVDAVMPLFKTPERERFLFFPDIEIAMEENGFFTRQDAGILYSGSFKDLKPYPIGVVAGYSYGKEFDATGYLKKIVTKNDLNLMQMFKFKRFNIGLGNRHVVSYFAKKAGGIEGLVFLKPPITRDPLYIAFSKIKDHEALATSFSITLRDFRETKAYSNILVKYGITHRHGKYKNKRPTVNIE